MPPLKITKKHHKHVNNPFPSPSKSLPLIHGTLSYNRILPHRQVYQIGNDFQLLWSSNNGGYASISHKSQPDRSLWSSIPGEAFVSAAAAKTEVEESRGSFVINDGDVSFLCDHQTIEEIKAICSSETERKLKNYYEFLHGLLQSNEKNVPHEPLKRIQFPALVISGWISSKRSKRFASRKLWFWGRNPSLQRAGKSSLAVRYWVLFHQKNSNQVGFQVKFGETKQQQSLRVYQRFSEGFHGKRWKQVRVRRRHRVSCFSSRRDFLCLSSDDEKEEERANGFKELNRVILTYSSERDEKFYGFGEQFSHMEFKGRRVPILVQEQGIGRGDQPITFAANLVSYRSGGDWSTTYAPSPFYMTSKMRCLYLEGYEYSIFDLTEHDRVQIQVHGNFVGGRILNGSSPAELIKRYTETIGRPPELPSWIINGAVIGMQGGTEAVRRVWDQLKDHDVPVSAFWLQRNEKPNKNKNLFEEAEELDILVKDKNGATYMIPNTAFDVGMLDLSHPNASSWFKKILHEMVDCGISGWMADFGEGLPLDANLFSGEDPITAHNRYPELWARVNREFVDEWKSKDGGDDEERLVFFMRAGFRESPKWAMLFWEGDQMVSWQHNDGIKSSVTGLLSSGLSGFALNHSDIGGYCAVNLPMIKYRRSEELLLRWMELNAFNTVYRTHEGNKPESNCQFYSNSKTLSHFSRFAKVYKAWKFYRAQLVKEASQTGLPVARHLFLHYPYDEHIHSLTYQQFLIGTEILVVPVLDKGKKKVKAYFPLGQGCSWKHIWTGKIFGMSSTESENKQEGFEKWVEAPIGYPAVFFKSGSPVGEQFMKNLQDLGIL
ncbi:uncharacterized protein LOC110026450 isoform X2 [Phalaenopsis equestris]|uniref:uncharacterized protein LOC110026450 isoform X2 n=1 Tax=Phalaenopsis equestris TaxID=78828 RepID=UPI0009E5CF7E|nr:uncharacterized protein LOC110026450 isoform X2 [Phalaenopsis equestris]